MTLRSMLAEDWPSVRTIYLEGIATGNATFQQTGPDWEEWNADHLPACRIVSMDDKGVVNGWAALSPVSRRQVYAGVAEISIYVAARARRQGVGLALLGELVRQSEREGFWTLQAGIFPENVASIELHRRHGFRMVGRRERVGCMNGQWRDVCLMERRSSTVG